MSHRKGTSQTSPPIKIQNKGTAETLRGSPSKRAAGTVIIATADVPLEGGTAQLRVQDAANAIKWDISLSESILSVSVETFNQVLETEDAFNPTFVGGVTVPTCSNTSMAAPVANSQTGRSVPEWHVKLKIQDQDKLTWCIDTKSVCDA